MLNARSSVAALIAAASIFAAAACGSNDDTSPPERPTYRADLAKRSSDPRGCVPNPRPTPKQETSLPFQRNADGVAIQEVYIPVDRAWAKANDRSQQGPSDDGMLASASVVGATVQKSLEAGVTVPSTTGNPGPTPRLTPANSGDRIVVVTYRLTNRGRWGVTPDQISGHLLLGSSGRWYAPTFKCRFPLKSSAAGASLQETGAYQAGAVDPGTYVNPKTTVKAAAAYIVPGGSGAMRWATSPYSVANRLKPLRVPPAR